ncbi:MAG: F0F1 ATP synthase subunit alpha [Alphaproteobacteria bacterium]|nr:F0F1 ATP synthase subunit alpha [Alphaproteobacteria bacterium]
MAKLLDRQADWLKSYKMSLRVAEQGRVASVGDGIAWVEGLPSAAVDDVLSFADGSRAVVFDLAAERIGAVMLHQTENLCAGTPAMLSVGQLSIPAGDQMLGRVVDPLGFPLDGRPLERGTSLQRLDVLSPPIIARDYVKEPLYSGIRILDTMIPMGKGQRQLIIGDMGLGRSSIALDTVINQRGKNVNCVYVLVAQKRSTVINTLDLLRDNGALEYTTLVVGEANALPGLVYLAPFAGAALAEGWMAQGKDTLVVYDDLTAHAETYRALSLLLRRPPGREAYPGDIFYLHSRLLERATCLSRERGGGSMTALPIVETRQGEIAAYIPTNLISITDGQIYLDQDLFASGFRPAIDIARSVSRIGGKAQHESVRREAGRMKLDYLQFLELEVFTRFGTKLDKAMEEKIHHGRALREVLKQDRLHPLPITCQMAWMIAFNERLFDKLDPADIPKALATLETKAAASEFTLDDPREQWVKAVEGWLAEWLPKEDAKPEAGQAA